MKCSQCSTKMLLYKNEKLQFGERGWFSGVVGSQSGGVLPVSVYLCPKCRKVEFYCQEGKSPRLPCPHCGKEINLTDTKCPLCGKNPAQTTGMNGNMFNPWSFWGGSR